VSVIAAACPHDCPDTCAMRVTVEDGRAVAIAGDPDHPVTAGFLCGKVSNYLERVYADDRILTPLLRAGPKGSGEFRQATWDEAIAAATAGLRAAIDRHGPESVLPYHYYGTQGALQSGVMAQRFLTAVGASRLVRTICASAGIAGTVLTQGPSPEVDPEEWPNARLIVVWGWNPMSTAPHLWRLILQARKAGARLVVVDPYRSRTARVADQHLRPVPGTDGALALALMRAMVDAGIADAGWCRTHATGYDDLVTRLGERDVSELSGICGLPEDDIRALAAALVHEQPSLIRLGVGAQRHLGAPIAYRTIACVPALAGSWRHRGGGFSYVPAASSGAIDSSVLARPELATSEPRKLNMSQIGEALSEADPPVAALIVWSSNPAVIAPDQERVLAGLRRDDLFTIVHEQFMTDTVRYADVVLPATTQLEHLDVVWSWGHHYVTLNRPAIAPVGEAKPTGEAFRLLARAMGLDDPAFRQTDEELLTELLEARRDHLDVDELLARGWTKVDLGQGPLPHAEGGFPTRDGRLQLRADALRLDGIDPLPFYDPPAETTDAELAARFPLALLTPKTHLFLNSTFANGERQHAAQPSPSLVIHPEDAAARGIADGDLVRVANDRGACRLTASVSDDAMPGVVVAPMGWWNADYPDGVSSQVTTAQRLTVLARAPTFNDNRVEVTRA
jgi:anaerobic selenocysteine-containing dehydrogenase